MPTSIKNKLSNQCSNLNWVRANLARFGERFGCQDGAKMAPNRSKNPSQNQSKQIMTFWIVSISILNDFGPQLGGSRGSSGIRRATFGVFETLLEPRWAQAPPTFPKTPPRSFLTTIFNDFGLQLNSFYSQLDWFSTSNLEDFTANQPAKQPINQPTIQPTSPRNHTSKHHYIPRPAGRWAEGNWIRRHKL